MKSFGCVFEQAYGYSDIYRGGEAKGKQALSIEEVQSAEANASTAFAGINIQELHEQVVEETRLVDSALWLATLKAINYPNNEK